MSFYFWLLPVGHLFGDHHTGTWGEFNDVYWCQALHITNKDYIPENERPQTLALLNSPQLNQFLDNLTALVARNKAMKMDK